LGSEFPHCYGRAVKVSAFLGHSLVDVLGDKHTHEHVLRRRLFIWLLQGDYNSNTGRCLCTPVEIAAVTGIRRTSVYKILKKCEDYNSCRSAALVEMFERYIKGLTTLTLSDHDVMEFARFITVPSSRKKFSSFL
tara:strand:+ start:3985 stop:4389 length:405 start_codon:yes stop_codon:yes gene_type:complete